LDLGIEIHLTQAGKIFRPEDECGVELIIAIAMAMRAHEESETKSKRLKEAFAQKRKLAAQEGIHIAKSLPWWLTWDEEGKKIICPPDRRKILERIFTGVTEEGKSPLEISRVFNDEGVPTWRPKTRVWLDNRVRDAINSDAVMGTIGATRKTKIAGRHWELASYYPEVIDPETVAKARAIVKSNRKNKSGRKPSEVTIPNILKSIVRYKKLWCRFSVHRKRANWNGYYEAVDDNRRMPWMISANQIEPILLASVADLTPDYIKPPTIGNAETALLRAEVKQLESTLANITMAVEAGSTTMIPRLVEIEKKLSEAKEQLAKADATDNVAVDHQAIKLLAGYEPSDLKDPTMRVEIASSIRRLISRIQVGSDLSDLVTRPDQEEILTLEDGDHIHEQPIEDPTGSRGKKPLVILITFHGGGEMAIQRGAEQIKNNEILITRIFRKGEPFVIK
jgi:hypothetical protein